jgi:hypothetical protein
MEIDNEDEYNEQKRKKFNPTSEEKEAQKKKNNERK